MGAEREATLRAAEQVLTTLAARKRMYAARRPNIVFIVSAARARQLLEGGVAAWLPLPEALRQECREVAALELENLAATMEAEPMGLQFGLLEQGEPSGSFAILRSHERATLALNPFPADADPVAAKGVAMFTSAEEAMSTHQRVAEAAWRDAHKGGRGAERLRRLAGRNATA
jgi:hypothetical protein